MIGTTTRHSNSQVGYRSWGYKMEDGCRRYYNTDGLLTWRPFRRRRPGFHAGFRAFRERAFGNTCACTRTKVACLFLGSEGNGMGVVEANRLTSVEVREGRSSPWFAR